MSVSGEHSIWVLAQGEPVKPVVARWISLDVLDAFCCALCARGGPKDGGSCVLFVDLADLRFCPRFDRAARQFAEA